MRRITTLWTCVLALTALAPPAHSQVEPQAGQWRTFVLSSGAQMRLSPPPTGPDSAGELQWLRDFLARRDRVATAQVAYWDAGAPPYRWMQIASAELMRRNIGPPVATRALALLSVAMHDATIAAWDSKYSYNRPRPAEMDTTIQPIVAAERSPAYPSVHAAVAGAAQAVLAYLFPDDASTFQSLAEEAARSRLFAGVQLPTDTISGLALGRSVGGIAVDVAKQDGSDQMFTGSFPPAPGKWNSPNPVAPLAGTWKPWVLASGGQFRLPPPPAADSQEESDQLALVKNLTRTPDILRIAWFWQASFQFPWIDILNQKIFEYHWDQNPPQAARVYALATVGQSDATLACWDTKYTYLAPRPSQVDATVTTLFANPGHPSYPSGHACASGGIAAVLGSLFPADAQFFQNKAAEAGMSTFYDGIHFQLDVQAGLALGQKVGQVVAAWPSGGDR